MASLCQKVLFDHLWLFVQRQTETPWTGLEKVTFFPFIYNSIASTYKFSQQRKKKKKEFLPQKKGEKIVSTNLEHSGIGGKLVFQKLGRVSCCLVLREEYLFLCPLQCQSPFSAAFHQGFSLSALCYCHSCSSSGPLKSSKVRAALNGVRERSGGCCGELIFKSSLISPRNIIHFVWIMTLSNKMVRPTKENPRTSL